MNLNDIERLREFQEEMLCLVEESRNILRREGIVYERAKAYWLTAIENSLTGLTPYDISMESTIEELAPDDDDDSDDDPESESC